jgi:small subunit ribosomal protein S16
VAVKIRLKKTGRKNRPSYRIVAMDAHAKRDGEELEVLGHYDPRAADKEKQVALDRDRVQYWLGVGAQPTDTVAGMFKRAGIKKA